MIAKEQITIFLQKYKTHWVFGLSEVCCASRQEIRSHFQLILEPKLHNSIQGIDVEVSDLVISDYTNKTNQFMPRQTATNITEMIDANTPFLDVHLCTFALATEGGWRGVLVTTKSGI